MTGTQETDAPRGELEDARAAGGSEPETVEHDAPLLPGELRPHPTPGQYVLVAVVLVVITSLEIATSYLDITRWIIIVLLGAFAATKFFLVAAWYMHLRTDRTLFRRFFVVGSVAAITLYLVVLATLHAWAQ
jgi:cytochrome c oxidase subunit 4